MGFISNLAVKCQSLKESNKIKYSRSEELATNSNDLANQEIPPFVDLAPTDRADEKGVYAKALNFATNSKNKILNIALTGPYGSGKSSVIQTFLTQYKGVVLQVSLAAFIPEEGSGNSLEDGYDDSREQNKPAPIKVDKKDIERSILQQMLYGADANKLPLSRFNRIQSPTKWAPFISLFSLTGIFATGYLLSKTGKLFNGELLTPLSIEKWFIYLMLAFSGSFLWFLSHRIYLQTFGISLKSVSLKNIELASQAKDEASILNKHLDEIIYFFQSTDYDLVIFEDLDRFNDPSIFVTLREINSLVNANAGVKRKVRFLYALRDDIFKNKERTKFFEFIIPVIPVINHSNSIDKILELADRQGLTQELNAQFLREVSRYLTDMRLIKSIFNEYEIYSNSIENDALDPNKLLAILIYKNVLPKDFEELHRQRGVLAKILGKYDESVSLVEKDCRDKIQNLEAKIEKANAQLPNSLNELANIYAFDLIKLLVPLGHSYLRHESRSVLIDDLSTDEDFEKIISSDEIESSQYQNHNFRRLDVSSLRATIGSRDTFSERKATVELKTAKKKEQIYTEIRRLKSKAASVRKQKFHEIIQTNEDKVSSVLSKAGENTELLRYLLFEGYLDDTYYQYISLFHKGRMSPNDNNFLINIRGFKTPKPEVKIDNPEEVISAMRDEDFARSYILNHTLVDYLLENSRRYSAQLKSTLKYISENFDECSDFFLSYYTNGKHANKFVTSLAKEWPSFAEEALQSTSGAEHIARILGWVPKKTIESLNENKVITAFLSVSGQQVFDQELAFKLDKLTALKVKIEDLSSIVKHAELLDHIIQNNLYIINPSNVDFVISKYAAPQITKQLVTSNLTTIIQTGNDTLASYIKENYQTYFDKVFFAIDTNTDESLKTLHMILSESDISIETKEQVLASQHAVFPSFKEVPTEFYSNLLKHKTIEPSWENLVCYRNSKAYDASVLTRYLQDLEVQGILKLWKLPVEEEATDLRMFIFNNNELEDEQYQTYIQLLPKQFKILPKGVSDEKLLILIHANKVFLNENNFSLLEDADGLQTALLIANINEYTANKEAYVVDDGMRERLISSSIANEHKYKILSDIDVESVVGNSELARNIADILVATDFKPEAFDFEYIESVIVNARKVNDQIYLLNKCQEHWTKQQIYSIIKRLPGDYRKIAKPRLSPKIPKTPENLIFAEWLHQRNMISSMPVKGKEIYLYSYKTGKDFNL